MTTQSSSVGKAKRAQPETFRARSLALSLTVKDLRNSVVWYRDVIGLVVAREIERDGMLRAVRMKAGVVEILLNQDDGAKGLKRKKGEGFSFQFTTAQKVDDVANRIKAQGGRLESEPADMPWGVRMFRVRDPDGFVFSISSPRPD